MQCAQVRQYLAPYVEGTLPGYKAAWVVQHLAGCSACSAAAADARRRSEAGQPPLAAALTQAPAGTETDSAALQRPVPAWLRVAAVAFFLVATGGAVWLLVST